VHAGCGVAGLIGVLGSHKRADVMFRLTSAFGTKRTSMGLAINVRFRGQRSRHKFMRHVRF
jgi:hypothetical protein